MRYLSRWEKSSMATYGISSCMRSQYCTSSKRLSSALSKFISSMPPSSSLMMMRLFSSFCGRDTSMVLNHVRCCFLTSSSMLFCACLYATESSAASGVLGRKCWDLASSSIGFSRRRLRLCAQRAAPEYRGNAGSMGGFWRLLSNCFFTMLRSARKALYVSDVLRSTQRLIISRFDMLCTASSSSTRDVSDELLSNARMMTFTIITSRSFTPTLNELKSSCHPVAFTSRME
mmetsp:Transcript_18347/g.62414  ORF Transcript_18347/g.62414 Transcript_18347/m.62414 type:complete len:231 (+) Transcript_18347:3458-4150(+)